MNKRSFTIIKMNGEKMRKGVYVINKNDSISIIAKRIVQKYCENKPCKMTFTIKEKTKGSQEKEYSFSVTKNLLKKPIKINNKELHYKTTIVKL